MILIIQCVIGCLLFSLVLVPAAKSPAKYLSMYPPAVQKKVGALPQYASLPAPSPNRWASVAIQGAAFAVVGIPLCLLAEKTTFGAAFTHMFLFFMVVNVYDFLVVDCLLFCRLMKFRFPGTEHEDELYKDYRYHFMAFLRGILLGVLVSSLVGFIAHLFF